MSAPLIRDAVAADAGALAALYNHYVVNTVATLQEAPVAVADIARQIAESDPACRPYLVAVGGSDAGESIAGDSGADESVIGGADAGESVTGGSVTGGSAVSGTDVGGGGDGVMGYCYSAPMRTRCAYRYTHEVSVYVAADCHRRGVGKMLFAALLARLARAEVYNLAAAITLPNCSSVRFHEQFGFVHCGTLPRVGYKFGQWRDVAFYIKPLRPGASPRAAAAG